MPYPSLTFTLLPSSSTTVPKFGPRIGRLALVRDVEADPLLSSTTSNCITMDTPNLLVGTSRGVVPHLSRDHTNRSDAVQWINVPFESFLEQTPPVPTLQDGPHPLHTFFGFDKNRHIASLCLRDPLDTREMPPNGNTHVSANCVRGVKKVTLSDWRAYVYKMQPDIVFALTDTPLTLPPYSQKRIRKSIERSTDWLADMLQPLPSGGDDRASSEPALTHATASSSLPAPRLSRHPLNVFVHMAGGTSIPAREAFAYSLGETLYGPEADKVKPFKCLDEGVSGYAFDLAVLRGVKPSPNISQYRSHSNGFLPLERPNGESEMAVTSAALTPSTTGEASPTSMTARMSALSMAEPPVPPDIMSLLKASLGNLPEHKPRLVTGIRSPHEMLRLIRDVGVDLFDVGWAVHAAHLGVALDFEFPVPFGDDDAAVSVDVGAEEDAQRRKRRVGHNLYDPVYARQFVRLADALEGAGESPGTSDDLEAAAVRSRRNVCPCIACSPRLPSLHILHSTVDRHSYFTENDRGTRRYEKPYTRAYVHHLLQTHEMSAHSFLVAHNLAIISAFLAGVRQVWTACEGEGGAVQFALEVERFMCAYDESGVLFLDAKRDWEYVDRARGKGRLVREREDHRSS